MTNPKLTLPRPIQLGWKFLKIVWPLPYTLWGLFVGGTGLLFGGKCQFRQGVVEFYGGGTKWFVCHLLPMGPDILAVTLGHVVLAQSSVGLDISRAHERVHVRQYERWGIFFIPAYLGCSVYQWLKGKRPYRDNPFEVEAYGQR